jgi:ABC-type transporter Mla subunit MlaD
VYEEHIIQKAKVRRNYAAQVLRRASLLLAQERSAYKMQIVQQERAYMKTLLDRWEAQQSGFSQLLQQSITAVKFPKDLVSAAGRLGTALERIDTIEQNLTATMHLSAQITDDYDQSNEQLRVLIDTVDQVAVDFSQAIDRLQASEQQTQTLLDQLSEEGKQLSDTWKEGHQAWLKEIENTAEHTAGVLRAQGVEIRRTGAQVQEGLERVERAYNQLVDTFNTAYEAKVKKPSDM